MTNNHVVAAVGRGPHRSAHTVVTLNDGRTAAFDVIATDPQSDIAVVRAHELSGLTPMLRRLIRPTFARSAGHGGGISTTVCVEGTITDGVVSALNRPVWPRVRADNGVVAFNAIQTNAAINPGNSGGALVDENGRLIGINSAEAALGGLESSETTSQGSIGLGFAIPVDNAMRIAAELIATGRASHAWLGAQVNSDIATRGRRSST